MKLPLHNPLFRIAGGFISILLLIVIGLSVFGFLKGESLSTGILFLPMIPLGMTYGPVMGIQYFGYGYIVPFLISLVIIVLGFYFRQKMWGQMVSVTGLISWVFFGLVGLGTGV